MADITQKDLKLSPTLGNDSRRVTLAISTGGDIELVSGKEKLSEQLTRAIVNDQTSSSGLGINNTAIAPVQISTLITLILRNFRQSQIYQTETVDPTCIGFLVYRFDRGISSSNFVKVSPHPISWSYLDTGLSNGFSYTYGVTKVYNTGFESAILEQLIVTPSQFEANQTPVIGNSFVAIPQNGEVEVFVDFNRLFVGDELLESIDNIVVLQDPEEPRKYIVNIDASTYSGNSVSLSSHKISLKR